MKYRNWLMAVCLAGACLAISLAATSLTTVLAHGDDWHPPLTVENPYIAPPSATSQQPLAGYQVDPAAPPIYRLPSLDEEVAVAPPASDATDSSDDINSADVAQSDVAQSDAAQSTDVVKPADDQTPPPDQSADVATNDDIFPIPGAPDPAATTSASEAGQSIAAAPEPGPTNEVNQPLKNATIFSANSAEMIPYMPVTAGLSAQLLPSVQRAYALAQRGSLYAAQTEFIQVLRQIAQAKDADEGYDDHSRALAAGLRALDEADDFAPSGVQLEAEMNVVVTVSSHRTPVLRDCDANVLPQEAIAQYHCYAQQQLAQAVDGEQAGSMALHGLGKVYCRLAEEAPNDARHQRQAMTMFLAALEASPQNHLAANEVGVLLSRGGHQAEAAAMFKRAIDLAPSSTAYRNLAICEQKLGQLDHATADGRYADQLASRERATGSVSRSLGVRWVTPQELAGVAQPQPLPPAQVAAPLVASRPVAPLGPAAGPANAQPTHAPNARWW
jgi:tetratricopeptide (TPR) repeat protein